MKKIVLLVHGWSVHHTRTYGELAPRLTSEARAGRIPDLDVRHIWLSRYVSFNDDIDIADLSRAFDAALRRELGPLLDQGRRFACITHSTGGPVVRDWLHRFYAAKDRIRRCPMSHLIMLAPANQGSALAGLGKSRLGRIKAWFEGVEPGAGILDWLTPGSAAAWELNRASLEYPDLGRGRNPIFQFVLTGQSIDRKLYDFLNSYTGEPGSDGVVRAASANLNTRYLRIEQTPPKARGEKVSTALKISEQRQAAATAFALIPGASHGGTRSGIMRSIRDDGQANATVAAITRCLAVDDARSYQRVCEQFAASNTQVEADERVDRERLRGLPDRFHLIDPHSLLILRLRDSDGRPIERADLLLTAGPHHSPNELPEGFMQDRLRNPTHAGTLALYLNQAAMAGCPEVSDDEGSLLRTARRGCQQLGLFCDPHLNRGLAHYLAAALAARRSHLVDMIRPHATTMIDLVMQRVVREGSFTLTRRHQAHSFKGVKAGSIIDES